MNLQQLRALVTISQTGSLRAAAPLLGVSQPALSQLLRRLEDNVGSELLQRSTRGVKLTECGHALLRRARLIEGEVHKARDELRQIRGMKEGRVSIAVSPIVGISFVPTAIVAFRKEWPKVSLRVVDALSPNVLPQVLDGSVDFAVGPISDDEKTDEFEVAEIFENDLVFTARAGHPRAKARSLRELVDEDWVLTSFLGAPGKAVLRTFRKAELPFPAPAVECDSFASLLALLTGSDLVAFLPRLFVEQQNVRDLVSIIHVRERIESTPIAVVRNARSPLTPAAQALALEFERMGKTTKAAQSAAK